MKKLFIVCAFVFMIGLFSSSSFAIQYCKDFLEPGNPGGWETSLKTFDDEWSLNVGEEVEIDIWLNDFPEKLLFVGFWITYDPSLVSIEDVISYDNIDLPGPWDPGSTTKISEPVGPGTYLFIVSRFYGVPPDEDGDIILGKVRFRCLNEGNASISISTGPDDTFDLVVGWPSAHVYDYEISPNTIILYQASCSVDGDCDDNSLCTTDSCNPSTGSCSFNPVIDCDDNNLCTADSCNPSTGECIFDPVDCNDWDACTADSCNPSTGECVHDPLDCNFGYSTDFLESGNPGGWTGSLKTFDDEWTLSPSEEIEVDIWLNDVPELMWYGGFWIEYDPSLVSIMDVKAYDGDLNGTEGISSPCCPGLSGPWGPASTQQIPNPNGPGTYFLSLGQSLCVAHDTGGDIILARVRFRCVSLGDATITVQTIPDFETTVFGCSSHAYDQQLSSHNIILHQVGNPPNNQAIPTLSEWGIIIFLTLILGISVLMLHRRREI